MNTKVVVIFAIISLFIGGMISGYLQALPGSVTGGGAREVVPLDGNEYVLYGRHITSDPATLQFYVDGEPISVGEVKKGVWLAHQKSDSGLFIFQAVTPFSTIAASDLTPPTKVWADPVMPDAGQVTYLHGKGVWDTSDAYGSLVYEVRDSAGNQVSYGSTVFRKRSGDYDTSTLNAPGNVDPITGDDTLYRQFKATFSAGSYKLSMWEFYNGIGKSAPTTATFTVKQPVQPDTTPPRITSFSATPREFESGNVLFKASFSDSGTGVEKAYIKWDNNGIYKFTIIDGEVVVSSERFACGYTAVWLVVIDGAGNKATDKVIVRKICPEVTPPPAEPPITEPPRPPITVEPPPTPPPDDGGGNVDNDSNLNKLRDENAMIKFLVGTLGSFGLLMVGYRKVRV